MAQLITEGVKEQFELQRLASAILDQSAVQNKTSICHHFENYYDNKEKLLDVFNKGQGIVKWAVNLLHSDIDLSNFKLLKDFVYNYQPLPLNIHFGVNYNNIAEFKPKTNSIHVLFRANDFVGFMFKYWNDKIPCEATIKRVFYTIFISPLIHELQHAYDYFRSKGRDATDKKSMRLYSDFSLSEEQYQKLYYSVPHEYWARFAEVVNFLRFVQKPTFQIYLEKFKEELRGWEHISPTNQKRLIRAIYKVYDLKYGK